MNKLASVSICLLLWSGFAVADPVLDEDIIEGIRAEFSLAMENADVATFQKYLYPGSKIIIDLDPSLSAGETEIGYEDYMAMLEMGLQLMKDAEMDEELLSISIDAENNQATLREKTTATMIIMGMKFQDATISETTFGVVGGEIKVLVAREQLISSGPVQ